METTGGSDSREPRVLDAPVLVFAIEEETSRLKTEPGYAEFGRSSKTLAKSAELRVVLTAARAGVRLGDDDADAALLVQLLSGRISVERQGEALWLDAGMLAWLGGGPGWSILVDEDATLALVLSQRTDDAAATGGGDGTVSGPGAGV